MATLHEVAPIGGVAKSCLRPLDSSWEGLSISKPISSSLGKQHKPACRPCAMERRRFAYLETEAAQAFVGPPAASEHSTSLCRLSKRLAVLVFVSLQGLLITPHLSYLLQENLEAW